MKPTFETLLQDNADIWLIELEKFDNLTQRIIPGEERSFLARRSLVDAVVCWERQEYDRGYVATLHHPFRRQWREVTHARYDEMLSILPPCAWIHGRGFLVGEPWDHHPFFGFPRFTAFVHYHGKFYEGLSPMGAEEWRMLDPRTDILPHVTQETGHAVSSLD